MEKGGSPLGFNDRTFSDWRLQISAAEEDDVRPRKKAKTMASSKLLHVNSLALANKSEFFRQGLIQDQTNLRDPSGF